MTVGNMVELVRQAFPNVGRTQIVFELNRALRELCFSTGILMTSRVLDRTTDYSATDLTTGEETWTMPNDTYSILSIDELYRDHYQLRDTSLIFHPRGEVWSKMLVRYSRVPSVMVNDSDSPAIPEEFHEALVSRVMAKYYRASRDLELYQFYNGEYATYERSAKRYVHSMRYRNVGAFAGDDMAQIVAYGTMTLAEGLNTVTMGKTFTSVTSFVLMLNGNGIEVSEYDPNGNNDQRTTSSFKVVSAAENPNFEYFAIGT